VLYKSLLNFYPTIILKVVSILRGIKEDTCPIFRR
jgi:hypothetical protein